MSEALSGTLPAFSEKHFRLWDEGGVYGIRNETMASSHIDYSRVVSSLPPFPFIVSPCQGAPLSARPTEQTASASCFSVASQVVLILFYFFVHGNLRLYVPSLVFCFFFIVFNLRRMVFKGEGSGSE